MLHVLNTGVCERSVGQIRTLIVLRPAKDPAVCVRYECSCSDPRILRGRDTSFAGAMNCIKFVVSWTCR